MGAILAGFDGEDGVFCGFGTRSALRASEAMQTTDVMVKSDMLGVNIILDGEA